MNFTQWVTEVDRIMEAEVGMSIHDLPDIGYVDLFDDGVTPSEAAMILLEEEGYSSDEYMFGDGDDLPDAFEAGYDFYFC